VNVSHGMIVTCGIEFMHVLLLHPDQLCHFQFNAVLCRSVHGSVAMLRNACCKSKTAMACFLKRIMIACLSVINFGYVEVILYT
jgi:hypothetical protein